MANKNYYHIFEKPLDHTGLDDWLSRTHQLRNVASTQRSDAFDLRQMARTLRNETAIQAYWDTYHNNSKLADRVAELDSWHEVMRICMDRLIKEINTLREEKNITESDLDALQLPLTVVTECLTMRDGRLHGELTHDDANVELLKELSVVENNQRMLRDECHTAWQRLNSLTDVKCKIDVDLMHKTEAKECDVQQLKINRNCSKITYKTDPMRNPKNSCTYPGWLEHAKYLKSLVDNELEESYRTRESLFVSREKAKNTLKAQQECTEHTIRRRVFETQRLRNELEWQLMKTKEEMDKIRKEIQAIEQALEEKVNALKLAETRLENRCQRPGMELCLDDVYSGLCDEVKQLRQTRQQLNKKLNAVKTTYNSLEQQAYRLETDLKYKEHSLMIDVRALDLRQRLRQHKDGDADNQTDRNIQLIRLHDEIPKI